VEQDRSRMLHSLATLSMRNSSLPTKGRLRHAPPRGRLSSNTGLDWLSGPCPDSLLRPSVSSGGATADLAVVLDIAAAYEPVRLGPFEGRTFEAPRIYARPTED